VHDIVTEQKSDAGAGAHSESSAKQNSAPSDFARVALECDVSSHRFHFFSGISYAHADKQDESV
jgi:predicted Zn-dependent protease